MEAIEERIRHMARSLRERLKKLPRVTVTDLGWPETQCGIVSFTVAGADAGAIKQSLRSENVYVSTSSAESTPLDAQDRSLPTVVSPMLDGKIALLSIASYNRPRVGKRLQGTKRVGVYRKSLSLVPSKIQQLLA